MGYQYETRFQPPTGLSQDLNPPGNRIEYPHALCPNQTPIHPSVLVVDPGVDGLPVKLLEFGLVTRYVIGACYATRMTEGEADTLNETEETHLNR